jgi:hypothetical protein
MNPQRVVTEFIRKLALEATTWLGALEAPMWSSAAGSVVRQFRDAGAVSPRTARRFYPRSSAEASAFAHLLETFVICQATPGHYFLDVDALQRAWYRWPARSDRS